MMYPAILAAHIIAACLTGGVIAYALYVVVRTKSEWYRTLALTLGFIATFEVCSGTVLAIISSNLSAMALTAHIVEYLSVCFVVEALLVVRMQKISFAFPTTLVLSPVLASVAFFVAAISYGF